MNPSFIWWLSCQAYKRKLYWVARFLKAVNFLVFHAILSPECEIEKDVELRHYGLGVVVHANVKIARRAKIYHHVTIGAETWVGSEDKVFIEDDVMIGAGAIILRRGNQSLIVGKGAKIGANAVVTKNVLPGQTVVGVPARPLQKEVATTKDSKQ